MLLWINHLIEKITDRLLDYNMIVYPTTNANAGLQALQQCCENIPAESDSAVRCIGSQLNGTSAVKLSSGSGWCLSPVSLTMWIHLLPHQEISPRRARRGEQSRRTRSDQPFDRAGRVRWQLPAPESAPEITSIIQSSSQSSRGEPLNPG